MTESTQLINMGNITTDSPHASDHYGKVRMSVFDVPPTTATETTFNVITLPAGRGRFLINLAKIAFANAGTGTFSMGHEAYADGVTGETVAASTNAYLSGVTIGTNIVIPNTAPVQGFSYNSKKDIVVTITTSAAVPVGGEIHGIIFYVKD